MIDEQSSASKHDCASDRSAIGADHIFMELIIKTVELLIETMALSIKTMKLMLIPRY